MMTQPALETARPAPGDRVKFDVTRWPRRVEAELQQATDPRQRAVLANYLAHIVLEISGLWEEILVPEMTVRHPVYRMALHGVTTHYDGMEEVTGLYRSLAESGATVMGAIDGHLWADEYGVAEEVLWGHIYRGSELLATGLAPGPDILPDRHYLEVSHLAQVFRYDENALLVGEFIYEAEGTYTYHLLAPEDVTTASHAREQLAPILDRAREAVQTVRPE